jgi:hypothetical protein
MGNVEMALAPNFHDPVWAYRRVLLSLGLPQALEPALSAHLADGAGEVWPVPIAHGEGRFTTKLEDLLETCEPMTRSSSVLRRRGGAEGKSGR